MDISGSEWSSGCESGWTLYLDESSQSQIQYQKNTKISLHHQQHHQQHQHQHQHQQSYRANVDDEEDLSMVSDASSGPPHFHYQHQGNEYNDDFVCFDQPRLSSSSVKSKKKKGKELTTQNNQHSFLDDTASSFAPTYTNKCLDPSNSQPSFDNLFGFSQGNGFTGNSAFGDQLEFWQPSQGRQQEPAEPSRSRGRRRG